jgi:prephenate dehydrogenase
LREMIRLAKSDSQLWAEITESNAENVRAALLSMEQSLASLRESLSTPAFQRLFEQGRKLDPDADATGADDTDPPNFG